VAKLQSCKVEKLKGYEVLKMQREKAVKNQVQTKQSQKLINLKPMKL
jgi:hypothetical protein